MIRVQLQENLYDMLRERRSRILYLGRMFDYPVSLNANTVRNLGPWRMTKIAVSYARARILPIRNESTLEQFMINRFGRELYATFFEDNYVADLLACATWTCGGSPGSRL